MMTTTTTSKRQPIHACMRILIVWPGGQTHATDTSTEPRRTWPAARKLAWRRALDIVQREARRHGDEEPVVVVLSGIHDEDSGTWGGDTVITRPDVARARRGEDVDLTMLRVV